MAEIFATPNFIVESHPQPFVDRNDGGHVRIRVKNESITDRTQLTPKQAIELMRLTMLVGEAMQIGLTNRGILIVKINYQDMGNWAYKENKKPFLHIHVFGRCFEAKFQIFPESVYLPDRSSGFYDNFKPLDELDVAEIKKQINLLLQKPKYQPQSWRGMIE